MPPLRLASFPSFMQAAGSDVANVACRAVKSACGQFYTVTGIKKWITNGLDADYFSTGS